MELGYKTSLVLGFVGLSSSTYYENISRKPKEQADIRKPSGRPIPGYSFTSKGVRIFDEQIKEWLCKLVAGDGFDYGYRKLTVCLQEDYDLQINHKKVYRLCKELNILRPQRKIKQRYPRRLAKREKIHSQNQLWEMNIKYGYIYGTDQFFFQLSLIDVFDRSIINYHLGLSCKAKDACKVLKNALRKRCIVKGMDMPKVRTDNGPQFISHKFNSLCKELGIEYERIPVKTPNMNAHIEAFHSILEEECYSRNEFKSFMEVYDIVSNYMKYYNERRRHGSIRNMPPAKFYEAFKNNSVKMESFIA
ncbi:integrase [Anoxybacter fermentans]|uniref:Integrase n=1 Tax=Anoxybacter fermentans TaxID=1323375 RepID=A0A3S9SXM2_9FIRM|nr:integrase [Anoxybacter fermentans]